MSYAIDKQGTLDLVGGSAQNEFDVGVHAASRTVHVARAITGPVMLGAWGLASDGTLTGSGADVVVGHGTRTRIVVFDNHAIVVLWIDGASNLRARGYYDGGQIPGAAITVTATVADFDVVSVGVTTGVEHAPPNTSVYDADRQFAFTTLSTNGSWSLWLGTVSDSAEVSAEPLALVVAATRRNWPRAAEHERAERTASFRQSRSSSRGRPGCPGPDKGR